MLCLAAYAAAAGGLSPLISTRGGAQDSVFDGGVWQLAAKMAADLDGAVILNAPVVSIAQDETGVTLASSNRTWRGKRVIVTAPPQQRTWVHGSDASAAMRS